MAYRTFVDYSGAVNIKKTWDAAALFFGVDYAYQRSRGNLTEFSPGVVIGGNENGDDYGVHLGGEYRITDQFALRGGIRWFEVTSYDFERPDVKELSGTLNGFAYSAGAGYTFQSCSDDPILRVDYGLEDSEIGNGGWQHLVTVTVPFDL